MAAEHHNEGEAITRPERDELEEYFKSENAGASQHPDLGFDYIDEIETTSRGLEKLIAHPNVSESVIGRYQQILHQQIPYAAEREEEEIGRRTALKRWGVGGLWVAGITAAGSLALKIVGDYSESEHQKMLDSEEALAATHTLSTASTAPSFRGWHAYYPRRENGVSYSESGVALAIKDGGYLQGSPSSVFFDTGFKLYKHERRDGEITPKIHITTQVSSSTSTATETASEEWVLRKPNDTSLPEIDPKVLVMEKSDPLLLQPLRFFLQVNYLGSDRFGAHIMQKRTQTP